MWRGRDVISARDFGRRDLEELFETARYMEKYSKSRLEFLRGRVMAVAFFEPSTRTRLSFEVAMRRLGGDVIGFWGAEGTSVEKGETLVDTVKMLDAYSDVIVVRHRYEGASKLAAEVAESPVINGGDGAFNHPTQAMLDVYTMWREFGTVDGLNVGLIGDLRHARTVNSLLETLTNFRVRVYLISPEYLRPRVETIDYVQSRGLKLSFHTNVEEVIHELDVLYVVRIQKERFIDPLEYEKVKGSYRITVDMLKNARRHLIILHPLPRVDEIDHRVDATPHARYFRQAALGVPLRMALLYLILQS
ncbi:aspartate carbamoyltransferase [Pyrobaculum neutrophilum]|uniref:Aspartate carbamoyltransferase catalytic subunit n=1 Tax=Pyrobaculum neutrophilum (strain DSM 2338 / JCM 9278 / NBRC 100436 / V24Sta) TaxID=444157 RepID=PYRB_PYRNV|nr:aspartate carbamoyltransferase [Pyrobaculum neutrophilum]B1Y9R0.1 RecName: Full=Aspartate carbamoyltransferase catalytic subunit; AltName: Full=Aspartate transcarbamylase; Short=ATCase [Pyrobaculum neutrophilum V24Sta]ACB38982.1 aspartate carbamoyltransferase [Pyrobaculum neutrophilum V24Sta]